MKRYLFSLILLIIVPVVLYFVADLASDIKNDLESKVENEELSLKSIESSYERRKNAKCSDVQKVVALEEFNTKWEPFLKNTEDILSTLDSLSFKNTVAILQKSIIQKEVSFSKDMVIPIKVINAKISGQYPRLYSWINDLENTFPQARIETLEFRVESGKTTMQILASIPYEKK